MPPLMDVLDHWQAWDAGLLAIVAAGIGGAFVMRQIRQSDRQERERIARKFAAARAVLPLALSYISTYEIEIAETLRNIHQRMTAGEKIVHSTMPTMPALGPDVILELKEMVEVAPAEVGDAVSVMLSKIQIQAAQLSSMVQRSKAPDEHLLTLHNVEGYIAYAAGIYARAAALFGFARRKTETVTAMLTEAEVASAMNQLDYWSDRYPRLHTMAAAAARDEV
jgi:hypothetical protein